MGQQEGVAQPGRRFRGQVTGGAEQPVQRVAAVGEGGLVAGRGEGERPTGGRGREGRAVEEGDGWFLVLDGTAEAGLWRRPARGDLVQRLGECGGVGADDDGTVLQQGTAVPCREHHVGHVVPAGAQRVGQPSGGGAQRGRGGRGHRQDVRRGSGGGGRGRCGDVLLDEDVGVAAGEPERADAGPGRAALGGPLPGGVDECHRQPVPVDVGRGAVDEVRRKLTRGQGQYDLQQSDDTGRGAEVADVRLGRPDEQRPVGRAPGAQGLGEGPHFDGVAERGAGAVRLHVVDVGG